MIISKDIKIKKSEDFTSEYIEEELKKMKYDVLRWAVTDIDDNYYTLSISIVCKD